MQALRRTAAFLVAVAVSTAPLAADLRYTMRVESRQSTEPPATPASPLMAMLGGMVASTMAPPGGLEITIIVGEQGSRVEYSQAYTVVPAGGVTLVRPDGSIVVIDPTAKTYWRLNKPDLSGIKADVTVTRTGQRSTMAGVPTERATLDIRVPLPVPAGTQLPPGIPTELRVSGEAWIADQYKQYSRMSVGLAGALSFGLEKIAAEGLPMKSVMRGEMFGDQQIESSITAIGELTAPPGTFDIPAGFTEVKPPSGMPGLPGMPGPAGSPGSSR
jgi:hypothetical protein